MDFQKCLKKSIIYRLKKIKKIMKKTLYMFLVAVLVFLLSPQIARADRENGISALDTVAGFETKIEASDLSANAAVSFEVVKPNGDVSRLNGTTDEDGSVDFIVPDTFTREAGVYSVFFIGGNKRAQFRVFPSEMSQSVSGVYSNKEFVAANGSDYVRVNIRIADEFGNPLQFHEIKLTSSRSSDRIIGQPSTTDSKGLASFLVSSRERGISTLEAVDESTAAVLPQKARIIFFSAPSVFREIGGDPESYLLAQSTLVAQASGTSTSGTSSQGPVARFEIENLAATVNINDALSFRIRAVNASGNTVTSYTGTVTFTSTDNNAQLPTPYTFQASDQGSKTFDLSLTFRTAGSQRLTVAQQGNPLIRGERTVQVLQSRAVGESQVRITRPAPGTYSVNSMDVEGEVAPNARVKIYDNGQQIAEIQANSTGRFSYRTTLLSDGQHTFNIESNGVQSAPVTITIDTTPARVENVQIEPQNVAPGATFQLSIRSDTNLNNVQATVGSDIIRDLEPDPQSPGRYTATMTAPSQSGEHTINVILTDNMGNPTPATEVGRIRVDAGLTPPPPSSFSVPSKVQSVTATAGNGRITLTWTPAQAENGIASYRVFYGTNAQNLNLTAVGSTTTLEIPNLQNGATYYFQVLGVDTQGNEGDNRSDVISSTPQANLGFNNAGNNAPVLCDPSPCPPDVPYAPASPEDGPGVIGVIIAALASSSVLRFLRKGK